MSGPVGDKKRLFHITAGNLRQGSLYINGHYDFFPDFVSNGENNTVEIFLDGLNETITTGIGFEIRTGKPSKTFTARTWLRRFFDYHRIKTGDILALERLGERKYRLYPFDSRTERILDWGRYLDEPLAGTGPSVIELFAGCGGMLLGFHNSGYKTVLVNEWDAAACESIRRNITERVSQCAIQEIEHFPKADVVVGGPPCQGFSNLGERLPMDPRRQLWRQFMRAVGEIQPKAFIMENVPPLLKSQEYVEIVKLAHALGYEVVGDILNAADYGVPQIRKRAIIIGLKGAMPTFPEKTHVDPQKRDLFNNALPSWKTVRDAIGDLPKIPDGNNWHIGRNPTPKSLERYRHIPAGGNRWDLPDYLMPECWKRKVSGGTDLFGRLWWDRPSVTIRTEFYKPEKGRYLHPEEDRPITHREAARLQGFPDDFVFFGTRIQVGMQIGNAVPPPLAEAIAKHVSYLINQ